MQKNESLLLFGLAILLIVVSFFIVRPFSTGLLSGIILSYLFYPMYAFLYKKTNSQRFSAGVTTAIAIILLSVIFGLILNTAAKEGQEVYSRTQTFLASDAVRCQPSACSFAILAKPEVQEGIQELVSKGTASMSNIVSNFFLSLPSVILNLIVAIFTLFYLFRDGPELYSRIIHALPVAQSHRARIAKQLSDVTYATMYGAIVVAIIQGVLGGIGFWVLGFPSPVVATMLIAVFALIPVLGAWVVWLPVALSAIIDGLGGTETGLVTKGITLLVYGTLVISGIDNLLKPKLIGERAGVHPVLIMIGGLGGLFLFGPLGFIIGPITLALLKTGFEIYERERNE